MLEVGTIGSGIIVDRMIDAIKQVNGIRLNAVYSRNEERAMEFAKSHEADRFFWDLDQFLSDPDLDVIYIASPNSLHYEQAKKALEHKKHILLEKPFCSTKEQAKELFEIARKNGVMIMEAITNIHTPNYQAVKSHLKEIGSIKIVQCNFSQYSSRYDQYKRKEVTNAFDPKMDGGALMDINYYNLHFVVGLFGMPKALHYFMNQGFNGIDTSGILVLEYPEFTAVCVGAKDSSSPNCVYIQGEEGTVRIDQASSGVCEHVDLLLPKGDMIGKKNSGNQGQEIGIDQGFHMYYELSDFVDMIEKNDQNAYSAYEDQTLKVMKLVDEAKKQRKIER
ncbi:Gfo/Idh/MocA family protein [Dubosiella newyorkensis]|uniref:Gfo/Idh/MocA family protein n=2 Tax=Dubosiella newyorkensis TaxID=1862672 RepID=UPI0024BA9719|nr:Gfo/Idh/MocA family oxidoreductase [Dubosiella newyorkensis]